MISTLNWVATEAKCPSILMIASHGIGAWQSNYMRISLKQ